MEIRTVSKSWSKIFFKYFFKNIASFSCRGCQAFSSDMQITYSTINNEGEARV